MPQLQPVNSSMIQAVGYEPETLVVRFSNGDTWEYDGVSLEVFEDFMESRSKGVFFNRYIKDTFPGQRVG